MLMRKLFLVGVLSLTCLGAQAGNQDGQGRDEQGQNQNDQGKQPTVKAPELDPGSAVVALSLLAGTLAVARSRRLKK